jgi:hypothetical protein
MKSKLEYALDRLFDDVCAEIPEDVDIAEIEEAIIAALEDRDIRMSIIDFACEETE